MGDNSVATPMPPVTQEDNTVEEKSLPQSLASLEGLKVMDNKEDEHEALITDDIHSSLQAYARQSMIDMGVDDQSKEGGDNLSLSSAETYGFSLDGVSTVANSVKGYGY